MTSIRSRRRGLRRHGSRSLAPAATAAAVAASLAAMAAPAAADTWYLESDGLVVVETESAEVVPGNWVESDAFGDQTGDGYLINVGPNGSPGSNGVLSYPITITEPGFYEFRWRSRIGRGEDASEHNDSWFRLATGRDIPGEEPLEGDWTKVYMNRRDRWTWDTVTVDFAPRPIRQYLDAGDHVIEIAGRSTDHAIDRFVLYDYDVHDLTPSGSESFQESEARMAAFNLSATSNAPTVPGGNEDPPLRADTPDDFMPIGECRFGRLTLEPTADVDVAGGDVRDGDRLVADAGGRRILMRFDLTGVPNVNIARLRTTAAAPVAEGRRDFWLGTGESWDEGTAAGALPTASVQLGTDTDAHEAEERIDVSLDASFVTEPALTVIVQAGAADGIDLRARESNSGRPRLVLKGNDRFCTDYVANGGAGESEENDGGAGGPGGGTDGSADGGTDGEVDAGTDDAGTGDAGTGDAGGEDAGGGDTSGAGDTGGTDGDEADAGDTGGDSGGDGGTTGGDAGTDGAGGDDASGGGDGAADAGTGGAGDATVTPRRTGGGALGLGLFGLIGVAGLRIGRASSGR